MSDALGKILGHRCFSWEKLGCFLEIFLVIKMPIKPSFAQALTILNEILGSTDLVFLQPIVFEMIVLHFKKAFDRVEGR